MEQIYLIELSTIMLIQSKLIEFQKFDLLPTLEKKGRKKLIPRIEV